MTNPMADAAKEKRKWPRSQRFLLSDAGAGAEASYRESITASRSEGGRASFELARSNWARSVAVEPDDGMYLGELVGGPRTLEQLTAAVDASGHGRKQVVAALERLLDAGLVLSSTPEPKPPPVTRWWR